MRALILALALAAGASPARAQNQLDAFQAFEGCWTGVFAGNSELHDSRCFMQVNFGRQWRNVHTVEGTGYGGVTMYAWDAELRRIDVVYYASDGALMRGYAVAESGGLSFPEARYVGADGQVQQLRSHWRFTDADNFEVVTERFQDGAWVELMRIRYARPAE